MVCSSRFSSRVGAERTLYTSTYSESSLPRREGSNSSFADMSIGDESFDDSQTTTGSVSGGGGGGEAGSSFVSIRGAWEAHAAELSTPERNPMSIVLDHESFVVGCSDGLVYR